MTIPTVTGYSARTVLNGFIKNAKDWMQIIQRKTVFFCIMCNDCD